MTLRCEKVKGLLEKYHDHELREKERNSVSKHLEQCESCSSELVKIEHMSSMLKLRYEELARSEDLSGLWNRVSEAIETRKPEPVTLRERLARLFTLPKPVWALAGAVAIALVLLFSFLPSGPKPALAANDCIIDSVDAENCSVMVYETGPTKMKIIWVMEDTNKTAGESEGVQDQETPPQEGVPS